MGGDLVLLRNDGTVTLALAADPVPGMTTIDDGPPADPDQSRRIATRSYRVPEDGAAPNVTFCGAVITSRTPQPYTVPAAT